MSATAEIPISPETPIERLERKVKTLFEKGGEVGKVTFLEVETPAHNFKHVGEVTETAGEAYEALPSLDFSRQNGDLDLAMNLVRDQHRDEVTQEHLAAIEWKDEDEKVLKAAALLHDIGVLRTLDDGEVDARKFYPEHVQRSEDKAKTILRTCFRKDFTDKEIERVVRLINFTDNSNKKRMARISFGLSPSDLKDEIMGGLLRQTDESVYTFDQDMVKTESALFWEFIMPLEPDNVAEVLGKKAEEVAVGLSGKTTWLEGAMEDDKDFVKFLTGDGFFLERVLKEHKGFLGLLDKKYLTSGEVSPYVENFLRNLRDKYELLAIWNDDRKIESHRHLEGTIGSDDIVDLGEELRERGFEVVVPEEYEIRKVMTRELEEGEHPVISRLATPYLRGIVEQLDKQDVDRQTDEREFRERGIFFEMLGQMAAEKILIEKVGGGKLEIAPFAYVKTAEEARKVLESFKKGMGKASKAGGKEIDLFVTLRRDGLELKRSETEEEPGRPESKLEGEILVEEREKLERIIAGFSLAGPEYAKFPLVDCIKVVEDSAKDTLWNIHIGETSEVEVARNNFETLLKFLRKGSEIKGISLINPVALLHKEMEGVAGEIKERSEEVVLSLNPIGRTTEDPQETFKRFLEEEIAFQIGSDNPNVFGHYSPLSLAVEYWLACKAFWDLKGEVRSGESLSGLKTFAALRTDIFDEEGKQRDVSVETRLRGEAEERTIEALPKFLG